MALIIQKFGGTSVANIEKIKNVATRIIRTKKKGNKVVVVVSAPGQKTDELIDMANMITDSPDAREMDVLLATGEQISISLLSMAIKARGCRAISLTGPQAGIYADNMYTKARIVKIKPKKLKEELKKDRIVIVAGFQGINPVSDITTLGRGGSDLTAVALAAVLKARLCEIYTDVEGVYTANPRLVPDARKISRLSYDEMLELAGLGAQVMQARSIEVAKKYDVPLHIRSSFSEKEGTIITKEAHTMEEVVVRGVTYDINEVKMTVQRVQDKPGVAAKIFTRLAKENINVDMIIQSSAAGGLNDISFTISRNDLKRTLKIMDKASKRLGCDLIYDEKVAKISIVGVGMRSHPGIASKMFKALADKKVNIEMISTSEIKISCVIKEKDVKKAVNAIHKRFGLDKTV